MLYMDIEERNGNTYMRGREVRWEGRGTSVDVINLYNCNDKEKKVKKKRRGKRKYISRR